MVVPQTIGKSIFIYEASKFWLTAFTQSFTHTLLCGLLLSLHRRALQKLPIGSRLYTLVKFQHF